MSYRRRPLAGFGRSRKANRLFGGPRHLRLGNTIEALEARLCLTALISNAIPGWVNPMMAPQTLFAPGR